jgi:hypothetical protein
MPDYTQTAGFRKDFNRVVKVFERLVEAIEDNTAAVREAASKAPDGTDESPPPSPPSDLKADRQAVANMLCNKLELEGPIVALDQWKVSGDRWVRTAWFSRSEPYPVYSAQFFIEFVPNTDQAALWGML